MKHTYLKSFFIASMLVPMLHFANEGDTSENQDHLPVAIRKPTHETPNEESASKFLSNRYPPVYFSPGMHCLSSVAAFGDSLEIEDGSVWKISSYDAPKVASWGAQDPILITQNHRWFSKYNYRIINQATGAALEANLFLGPIKDGTYTRYIMSIDTARGELILNDNTRWAVSSLDEFGFKDWVLYDAVIIGYNSGWDSSCQGLLINVNMNQCIRAQQF